MGIKRYNKHSKSEYTVSYSAMHGVDFSPEPSAMKRYRYSELDNMYRDYDGGGAGITESIPGFRKIASFGSRINSIFSYKDINGEEYIVVHAGTSIFRFPTQNRDGIGTLRALISASDTKSSAFCHGSDIYILDGTNILRINGYGVPSQMTDNGFTAPYVPTTYYNGEEYEQRNLLTNRFIEKYRVSSVEEVSAGSEGLNYRISSIPDKECCVSGIADGFGGSVTIPAYKELYGEKYKVTEICDNAFYANSLITRIVISDGVQKIGKHAFYMCSALEKVITYSSLTEIDDYAFNGCSSLNTLYLGAGIQRIGSMAFQRCNIASVYYALTEQAFDAVENLSSFGTATFSCSATYNGADIEIPIFTPAASITEVLCDGGYVNYSLRIKDSIVTAIVLSDSDKSIFEGKEFTVSGIADEIRFTSTSIGTNFMAENAGNITGRDAIVGCRVCESFDGRVFLSGNPLLPNTVFYSARDATGRNNPLYFGVLNYFNDGIGSFAVESMLAVGNSLAVFKSGDDGCGSIYYHTAEKTGNDILPVIYPVSYVHSGIHAVGESISFFDDPIFISSLGVCALDKKNISSERSIAVRSHNVNQKLLSEDLRSISMTKWCGYLVVCTGEHIYLADSRDTFVNATKNTEYEWYYLSGIGSYSNDSEIYEYAENVHTGYYRHPSANQRATETVYMDTLADLSVVFYTLKNGKKYEVHRTGRKEGGVFHPATTVYSTVDDLLFFGTERGDLCIFNNDKRGTPPPGGAPLDTAELEEYRKIFARKLHPYYYSFAQHAPKYKAATVSDNGVFPHFEKTTVKNSLTAKLRIMGNGSITCQTETEKNGYSEVAQFCGGSIDFSDIDFSKLAFSGAEYITIPFKEREKGWIEKKVSFSANEHESPFGLCNTAYRFSIKGKIKN